MKKILGVLSIVLALGLFSCTSTSQLQTENKKIDTSVQVVQIPGKNIPEVSTEQNTLSIDTGAKLAAIQGDCPLCIYWYKDFDHDGYGANTVDEKNPLFKKKQPFNYINRSGDCDDTNPQITSPITYYLDNDQDGFGGILGTQLCTLTPGKDFSTNSLDCDDFNSNINPDKVEVWNGLDDNCNTLIDEGLTSPGIVINTTKALIPEYMGAGGTSAMFAVPANDPKNQTFIDLMISGHFNSYIGAVEGHESEYSHFKLPYGTKGSGYNPPLPCDPRPMNGELCKTYQQDFFLSWMDLCNKTNAKAVYTANIQTGSLQDIYYFINQFSNQETIVIFYGLEGATSNYPVLTSKTYPPKFYQYVDSVNKKFPDRKIYHLADMPEVKKNPITGKYNSWIQDFVNYRAVDSNKIGIRQYYHGFDQYGNLTRIPDQDSSIYTAGLPVFNTHIDDTEVLFKGCPIFVAQFSTDVPVYVSKLPLNGRIVDMFWYLRAEKIMIERTTSGQSNFIGSSIIGLKSMFNSLNFPWLSVINNMYLEQRTYCTVQHSLGSQVDMLAGYKNGKYSLLIQNRSGKEIDIPEYFLLDLKYTKPTFSKVQGFAGSTLGSTTGAEHNPLITGKLSKFSIVYLEF